MGAVIERQTTRGGRPCAVCSHRERQRIEEALTSGEQLTAVSAEFGMARSSLRRHRDAHMAWSLEDLRSAGAEPVALIVRLAELAERMRSLAVDAEDSGRVQDAVRASDAERRALVALLSHGAASEDLLGQLDMLQGRQRALARVLRREPGLAEVYAEELAAIDRPVDAEMVRRAFLETTGTLRELAS